MIEIELTDAQLNEVTENGRRRNDYALKNRAQSVWNNTLKYNIAEIKARMAFSVLLNVPFTCDIEEGHNPDVRRGRDLMGCRFHVTDKDYKNALVKPKHEDDCFLVTCIDGGNKITFLHYIKVKDAKNDKYFRRNIPVPAYIVPLAKTKPIEELIPQLKEIISEAK
jgi:hypothetical protein